MSTHIVRITHDPESHAAAEDCHDDCTAEVICPGVTEACRCWWECGTCRDVRVGMSTAERAENDDRLLDDGEAHGVDHLWIDGMWMTPGTSCISAAMDTDADQLVDRLPTGDHPVDLECEEGFVYVRVATSRDRSGS